MSNPWGLSAAEVAAVEAIIATGSHKAAARQLCKSPKTIETQVGRARRKMKSSNRIACFVAYYWWQRTGGWVREAA